MQAPRRTVTDTVAWNGKGLHGGQPCTVRLHPGGEGIWFRAGTERVAAHPDEVTDTRRATQLGPISTIEHLMSALAGLGITDAEVEVEGGELPALDGSALPYAEAILAQGTTEIGMLTVEGLFKRVFLVDEQVKVVIAAGEGRVRYEYDAGERWPGLTEWEGTCDPTTYISEIAPARTFAHHEEVALLQQAGLGQGLDESSCLVLGADGYTNQARFSDEPSRHKALDLIGDIYLAGVPPQLLNLSAHRSGHRTNVAAAKRLADTVTIVRA